jgi:hypothetical protein
LVVYFNRDISVKLKERRMQCTDKTSAGQAISNPLGKKEMPSAVISLVVNQYTCLAQDIVETPRETYKGLTCDHPSQRVKLGELKLPR